LRNGEPELPDLGRLDCAVYLRIATFPSTATAGSLVDYVPMCVRGQEDADPAIAR